MKSLIKFNLFLHAEVNTNVTADAGMTVEMKTYYDKVLLKNAFPKLVHNQFGQKRPPQGWRQDNPVHYLQSSWLSFLRV